MTLIGKHIKNDNAFKGAAYVTLFVSILSVSSNLLSLTQIADILNSLPLANLGFNWVVPAVIGAVIGGLIKTKEREEVKEVKEA